MEVAGPLGTPLGLAQRKRASPRGEAGTSGFLCVSDSDRAAGGIVPTASQPPCPSGGKVLPRAASGQWLGMESQAGLCWRGCWERCPELREQLWGLPLVGGLRCQVRSQTLPEQGH